MKTSAWVATVPAGSTTGPITVTTPAYPDGTPPGDTFTVNS